MRRPITLVAVIALMSVGPQIAGATVPYVVTDLGRAWAECINNSGQIYCWEYCSPGAFGHSYFIYSNGTTQDITAAMAAGINVPWYDPPSVSAMNDSGQLAGSINTGGFSVGFAYSNGSAEILGLRRRLDGGLRQQRQRAGRWLLGY